MIGIFRNKEKMSTAEFKELTEPSLQEIRTFKNICDNASGMVDRGVSFQAAVRYIFTWFSPSQHQFSKDGIKELDSRMNRKGKLITIFNRMDFYFIMINKTVSETSPSLELPGLKDTFTTLQKAVDDGVAALTMLSFKCKN